MFLNATVFTCRLINIPPIYSDNSTRIVHRRWHDATAWKKKRNRLLKLKLRKVVVIAQMYVVYIYMYNHAVEIQSCAWICFRRLSTGYFIIFFVSLLTKFTLCPLRYIIKWQYYKNNLLRNSYFAIAKAFDERWEILFYAYSYFEKNEISI